MAATYERVIITCTGRCTRNRVLRGDGEKGKDKKKKIQKNPREREIEMEREYEMGKRALWLNKHKHCINEPEISIHSPRASPRPVVFFSFFFSSPRISTNYRCLFV